MGIPQKYQNQQPKWSYSVWYISTHAMALYSFLLKYYQEYALQFLVKKIDSFHTFQL